MGASSYKVYSTQAAHATNDRQQLAMHQRAELELELGQYMQIHSTCIVLPLAGHVQAVPLTCSGSAQKSTPNSVCLALQ